MISTIKISDEVYKKYEERDKKSPRRALERTIECFQDVNPEDRTVILTKDQRVELEKLYGKPIEDFSLFLRWLVERSSVTVEGVKIPLKGGQLKYLSGQVNHYKRPLEDVVREAVQNAIDAHLGAF